MSKRNVGAMVVGGVVVTAAGIASCSFPTYNITVTGGAGGSATSATASASATGSTGSVGGGAATSSGSAGGSGGASSSSGGGGASTTTTSGTTTSSATTSTSSGPCTTDEDGDGFFSWECGGSDCADHDVRAHPGADFTPGAAIMGLRSPTTLPYDFNCALGEEKQTATLSCTGLICGTPATTKGYQVDAACGSSGALGHCSGAPCGWVSDSMSTLEICK